MTYLAVALILFLLALVIFAIDLMLPTGGVLVAVTALLAFGSIVCAFRYSFQAGLWMTFTTFAFIPILIWVFIVVWPRTPMGRRMIIAPKRAEDFVWADARQSAGAGSLIGAQGEATTDMLPSGKVLIAERTYEAFSETGPIDRGARIKVIRLDVGRLVVMEQKDAPRDQPAAEGTDLDRPANELNLESLDG